MLKKNLNITFKKAGFTMLELIVVFVIIGILATIGVPNYKKFQSNQALKESVQQIETELGKAFSSARSHPEHFGLKLVEGSDTQIELFKIALTGGAVDSAEEPISAFDFGKGIRIQNEEFKIIFERPYGDIREGSSESIILNSPTGKQIKISINRKSGLVTHETYEE